MTLERLTDVVIFATIAGLIAYNVAVGYLSGGTATISHRVRWLAHRYPEIVFVAGALAGHWFWTVRGAGRP